MKSNIERKTDVQWLSETIDSAPLTKYKLAVIGQLALKDKLPIIVEPEK